MRKIFGCFLILMLLLTCACGKEEVPVQGTTLTEGQQDEIMEDIRQWAESNLEKKGEIAVEMSSSALRPEGMGFYAELGGVHLYDLTTGQVREVDGTYPDTAELGAVLLTMKEGQTNKDVRMFYLTYGTPTQTATYEMSLKQTAKEYPDALLTELSCWKADGLLHYLRMDFDWQDKGYIYEFSTVSGAWGVRQAESTGRRQSALQLEQLPAALKAVIRWQESHATEHDRENYHLCFIADVLNRTAQIGTLDQLLETSWKNRVVYDLVTGKASLLEGSYTGAVDYGYFSLLYPAEEVQQWVYLLDSSGTEPVQPTESLVGKVAVLTANAPLQDAWAETVDAEGNVIVMDMAVALKKGTLVYVGAQEEDLCSVSVLAGEPPHPQGWLEAELLSTEPDSLLQADQVILNETPTYAEAGGENPLGNRSGVAQVEMRNALWWKVALPGGEEGFWIKPTDLMWEWPLTEEKPEGSWLPEVGDDAQVYQWRYQVRNGEIVTAELVCMEPAVPRTTAWKYDRDGRQMTEQAVPDVLDYQKEGSLTTKQLPALLDGIKGYLDDNNEAWQQSHWLTLGWMFPKLVFDTQPMEEVTYLIYDLNTGTVQEMPEIYRGSREYGAISVMVMTDAGTDRSYYFVLDDGVEAPLVPEPETPEVPVAKEPQGTVDTVNLAKLVPGCESADLLVALDGRRAALRCFDQNRQAELVIVDVESREVLSREKVTAYNGTNRLTVWDDEPYVLIYYDGWNQWTVTLDETWKMTVEEDDAALRLSTMGDLIIRTYDGSISVGQKTVLEREDRMAYEFVRVLNEHQMLYRAVDGMMTALSHYGVYDNETREARMVTAMGQTVVGAWDGLLLVAREENGVWYDFGWVSLDEYVHTPLKIGHETAKNGIPILSSDNAETIQYDAASGHLLLCWDRGDTRTMQVVDVHSSAELYRWESLAKDRYTFLLAGDNRVFVQKATDSAGTMWTVEY